MSRKNLSLFCDVILSYKVIKNYIRLKYLLGLFIIIVNLIKILWILNIILLPRHKKNNLQNQYSLEYVSFFRIIRLDHESKKGRLYNHNQLSSKRDRLQLNLYLFIPQKKIKSLLNFHQASTGIEPSNHRPDN